MPRKTRRIRSPHPGVVIKERALPSGATAYRARFDDPDTGRETYVTLDAVALPTREARRLWAIRKSKALAQRRMELEGGSPRVEARALADAAHDYFRSGENRLRSKTIVTYRLAVDPFVTWCGRHGVRTTADLTRAKLAAFRDALIARTKLSAVKGGRRGQVDSSERKRSPLSINRELRTLKTLLNAWRQAGIMVLTRDDIADALKALQGPREQPVYLHPAQIRRLLEAAARHDAAVFTETRAEHAGRRPLGTTRRYEPIAPFTAFLLLAGCRRGEALALTWSDVDLDAVDHEGRKVGEIRLKAEATKTKHARTIGLEVSPALRAMLAEMQLRAAPGEPYVFGGSTPYSVDLVDAARARLLDEYGAPKFDWQALRSTCATFLTNAPGIFGAATVFMSARQLGHSVQVAERHYLNVHRGIPRDARTLEAAMQVEDLLQRDAGGPARSSATLVRAVSSA